MEAMNSKIYLYHREKKVKTLGPGERYAIWTQGCPHNCEGCIAKDSHSIESGGEWVEIKTILDEIDENIYLKGVTISGGEPFIQKSSLLNLVKEISKRGLNIICYTGFIYEELKKSKEAREILKYIDILIDGKYEQSRDSGSYLRGSDNQRIIHLKNTFKKYEKMMLETKNRNVEIKFVNKSSIFIVGLPPVNLNKNWDKVRENIYKETKR